MEYAYHGYPQGGKDTHKWLKTVWPSYGTCDYPAERRWTHRNYNRLLWFPLEHENGCKVLVIQSGKGAFCRDELETTFKEDQRPWRFLDIPLQCPHWRHFCLMFLAFQICGTAWFGKSYASCSCWTGEIGEAVSVHIRSGGTKEASPNENKCQDVRSEIPKRFDASRPYLFCSGRWNIWL